jgi:uncharacterized protein YbjT (DUF2867 family)
MKRDDIEKSQNEITNKKNNNPDGLNFNKDKTVILITGASGFIGSRLLNELIENKEQKDVNYFIRGLSRHKNQFDIEKLRNSQVSVEIMEGDLSDYDDCVKALSGVDIAYYLVHSMEGSSRNWKKFSEREKITAENFMNAANQCNVKRIIYLGGLTYGKDDDLSQHMQSRKQVGDILKKSKSKITIFRAAVILGSGGGSFEMLRYLVERLPLMVCPKWVLTKCQPIFIGDVITYLSKSIEIKETEGRTFDIGGPDILSYLDMMKIYAKILDKSIKILIIPFLTPRLSSYWVDLVTPIRASLARPLIDSLKHESTVRDDSILRIIPTELKPFKESLEFCMKEEKKYKKKGTRNLKKERTSLSINYKILLISLLLLVAIGTTYYFLDDRKTFLGPFWLSIAIVWYILILTAIYFVRFGARLGALIAGILAWGTLFFWILDNAYIVFGHPIIAQKPGADETWRDMLGIIIAIFTILSSHNIFHKIRLHS